jgi:glycosyltransferase involved in cell wall biosynthesis
MPLVVAEALYFGLPIIGSNQEMIMEGMGAAGLSFESGNAAELADKIRTLVKDDELYNRLSRRAQDRSSQFLPDHFLSAVQDVLHDATDAPRRTNERPLYPDASPQADPTPN